VLDQITPLLLTYNEAPNIARTLEELRWARDIVVIDSFSDDETLEIVSCYPQARVFQRKFDSFASQCNFGLNETGIQSEWVLSLDADYVLTPEFSEELAALDPDAGVGGYRAGFTYCINGRRLRSGVYPPVTVLFRRSQAMFRDDGHAHRVVISGAIGELKSRILHDDRKSLERWFQSQRKYVSLEAKKLIDAVGAELTWADRVRKKRLVAPLAMLVYCLVVRGGILDGWPGLYYAFQRTFAELMLSLYLIEADFNSLGQRIEQKAVGRKQKAVGGEQWAEGRKQKAVGRRQ
jgi:glycosyltransferase involved in cell wall biosynthesis